MSRAKAIKDRNPRDYYPTPHYAFNVILPYIESCLPNKHRTILEPACGDRRLVRWLKKAGYKNVIGEDIVTGNDYFNNENFYDMIVTNPPFRFASGFINHATKHSKQVFLLLRVGILESVARHHWWQTRLPDAMLVLSRRPSFTNDGKTDGATYAWFYWGNKLKGIYVI